jgi:ribose-phosphate pyrophosphokinase
LNETRIHVFPDSLTFGQQLGRAARLPTARVSVHRFPDGESLVRIQPPVARDAIVVRSLFHPNAKLIETILAADALRHAGAQRVTLVAPYLPYMRQDSVFSVGEPISQRAIGALLGRDFDAVLTIEAHLHRVFELSEVIPGRARSISAAPAIGAFLARRRRGLLLVGPDEESRPWVEAVATTAQVPWIVGEKTRRGDRSVRIRLPALPAARRAVLLDDIASSGSTLAAGARALRRAGMDAVEAVVVHAIFAPGALGRVRAAGVTRIESCDTVPHRTNAIRTASLVAQALAWK